MRRAVIVVLLLLVAVSAVALWHVGRLPAPAARAAPVALDVDPGAVPRLAAAIRIATVSPREGAPNDAAFEALAALLRESFPRVDRALTRETVGAHGLLYRWEGRDPALPPLLMLAHQDVVPVDDPGRWRHAPFSGDLADGYVWGRGTLDDKASLLAQLEAVEALLAQGYAPQRTVWLAFGHDEEVGGEDGARRIAALLQSRGVRAAFGVDEGGAITHGVIAGVDRPVASIMLAEKGYASFALSVETRGGHSSMPPAVTAIGRLARAVARLEAAPMPAHLTAPVAGTLEALAPALPFVQRLAIANRWLFGPLLLRQLGASPVTNALIRTTTAPTMFNAGVQDNVLPGAARAVVNFRILPSDTIAAVQRHVVETVDDPAVAVKLDAEFAEEPSPVSDAGGAGYALLRRSVEAVYPDAIVAPGLVVGATDLRHYAGVVEARYNFLPGRLEAEDLERIHGSDERIAVAEYENMVRFYQHFIGQATAP